MRRGIIVSFILLNLRELPDKSSEVYYGQFGEVNISDVS